jgi:hypothetical protein
MSFYASSATLGGTGKLFRIVAAILLIAGISATQASAGDLSAQPRDSLSVVGSSTGALPGATGALPRSGGPVAAESGWLSRFHVTGYLSEQFGMWQNPRALRSFTPARNNLAVARTTLQFDENFQLDENNSFLHARMVHVRPAVFVEQRQQPPLLPRAGNDSLFWWYNLNGDGYLSRAAQLRPFHQRRVESI